MHSFIQKRVGLGAALCAILLSCIQFFAAHFFFGMGIVDSLLDPSVYLVFLSGLILLLTGFYRNTATRIFQVTVVFFTGYASSLTSTSGELSYLVFMGIGYALALEYGFLKKHFILKTIILLTVLICCLFIGMRVMYKMTYLSIIHSLIGGSLATYIFFILIQVRILRYNQYTTLLEETVTDRTKELQQEMEVVKALQVDLEQTLEEKNRLLEEKDLLLKEVLHRTKNNMQLISSFLSLEQDTMDSGSIEKTIDKCMNRIKTMSLAHELLYRSDNLTELDLKSYVNNLVEEIWYDLFDGNFNVSMDIDPNIPTSLDFAIPFGLILNELMTNTYRHAFPSSGERHICIRISRVDGLITFLFQDNGIGIPEDIDPKTTDSLGIQLVAGLIDQLEGSFTVSGKEGTHWMVTLPVDRK